MVIDVSAGGAEAIRTLLLSLSAKAPPIVIVLHISANFSHSLAEKFDGLCAIKVVEAKKNQAIKAAGYNAGAACIVSGG